MVATASSSLGRILIDGKGRTVYLFEKDKRGHSTCSRACPKYSPPLLARSEPTAGRGARRSLLGVTRRSDRTTLVTYGGHPLYRFLQDRKPGETSVQDSHACRRGLVRAPSRRQEDREGVNSTPQVSGTILAISGSLRRSSINTAVLRAAAAAAARDGALVVVDDSVRELPHFDPDLEIEPTEAVLRFRAACEASAGVLLAVPEYTFGVPGAFKNALDWTVRSGSLYRKPITLLNVAAARMSARHWISGLGRTAPTSLATRCR